MLPLGPVAEAELVQWEVRVADGLAGPGMLQRLQAHMIRGVEIDTRLSGLGCACEAFRRGLMGLTERLGVPTQQWLSTVRFTSTCNHAAGPTQVACLSYRMEVGHRCQFTDYMHRLPSEMQVYINAYLQKCKGHV